MSAALVAFEVLVAFVFTMFTMFTAYRSPMSESTNLRASLGAK